MQITSEGRIGYVQQVAKSPKQRVHGHVVQPVPVRNCRQSPPSQSSLLLHV